MSDGKTKSEALDFRSFPIFYQSADYFAFQSVVMKWKTAFEGDTLLPSFEHILNHVFSFEVYEFHNGSILTPLFYNKTKVAQTEPLAYPTDNHRDQIKLMKTLTNLNQLKLLHKLTESYPFMFSTQLEWGQYTPS